MKNIFRAVAQTSSVLKSFKVLMLVFLVTFAVTSCENQTEANSLVKSEAVSEPTLTNIATQTGTENPPTEIGDTPGVETRRLCNGGQERRNLVIGNQGVPRSLSHNGGPDSPRHFTEIGDTNGTERRNITIGGNQTVPRSLSEIGGQEASIQLVDIGGTQGTPRSLSEIGGQGCPRQFSEIGGNQTAPRSLTAIGGGQEPRKLSDIGGNGGSVPPRSVFEVAPEVIPIGGNYAPRA